MKGSRYAAWVPAAAASALLLTAGILSIVALAGTSWTTLTVLGAPLALGLWTACSSGGGVLPAGCLPVTADNLRLLFSLTGASQGGADTMYSLFVAVRVLGIIAAVAAMLGGLAACGCAPWPTRAGVALPLTLAVVALATGVTAVALFGGATSVASSSIRLPFKLGGSWVNMLVGVVLAGVAAAVLAVRCCRPGAPGAGGWRGGWKLPAAGAAGAAGATGVAAGGQSAGGEGSAVELASGVVTAREGRVSLPPPSDKGEVPPLGVPQSEARPEGGALLPAAPGS
jgi:hypothetical protein